MYVWIWRHLPGSLAVRLVQLAALLAAAVALLFFVVFPRVEPLLPYSEVTVNQGGTPTHSPG